MKRFRFHLINETQSVRLKEYGDYYHIVSIHDYTENIEIENMKDYVDKLNFFTKNELYNYLIMETYFDNNIFSEK